MLVTKVNLAMFVIGIYLCLGFNNLYLHPIHGLQKTLRPEFQRFIRIRSRDGAKLCTAV